MNKYWFKQKTYGYGYVPISIEGWIATLGIILVGLIIVYINKFFNPLEMTIKNSFFFLIEIIILGFVFVKIFEKRCKGKLHWNWGNKNSR